MRRIRVAPRKLAVSRVMVFSLAAVGLGSVVLWGCKKETPPPPPPPDPATLPENQPPPRPPVTQAQFDKLLYDMTLSNVEELFGMEPSRQDSTYDEGVEGYTRPSLTSWYIWENPDGSFIKLGFTNDKLTDMVSENLPPGNSEEDAKGADDPSE